MSTLRLRRKNGHPKFSHKTESSKYIFDYPIHDQHTQIIHVSCFDEDVDVDDPLGSFQGKVTDLLTLGNFSLRIFAQYTG